MIAEHEASVAEPLTSGARLRKARESLGLSAEEVAAELRLSVSQIKALEQDDYAELPGATYVRGYLRSYARLVKVDEDSVLPPIYTEPVTRSLHAIARPVQRQARSSDRWMRLMSYSLGVLLIGLVIAWWRSQGGFDFEKDFLAELPDLSLQQVYRDRTAAETTVKEGTPIRITASPAETDITPSEPRAPKALASTAAESDKRSTLPVLGKQGQPPNRDEISTQTSTASTARQAPAESVTTAGKIVLKFSQASWAEVRDASNERLLHQSFHAGREIEVVGMPPFSVFLGNAGGVRMEYNGKPFDITPHQTGLYARFVIEGAGGN